MFSVGLVGVAFLACIVLAIVAPLTSLSQVDQPPGTVWNPRLQKFTYCYTGERCTSDVCDLDGTCAAFACVNDAHCFVGTSCIDGVCGISTSAATEGSTGCSFDNLCLGSEPDLFCDNSDGASNMTLTTGTCKSLHKVQRDYVTGWLSTQAIEPQVEVLFSNMSSNFASGGGSFLTVSSHSSPEDKFFTFIKKDAGTSFRIMHNYSFDERQYSDDIVASTTYEMETLPSLDGASELQYSSSAQFTCPSSGTSFQQPCGPSQLTLRGYGVDPVMVVYRAAGVVQGFRAVSGIHTGTFLALQLGSESFYTFVSAPGSYVTTVAINAPASI